MSNDVIFGVLTVNVFSRQRLISLITMQLDCQNQKQLKNEKSDALVRRVNTFLVTRTMDRGCSESFVFDFDFDLENKIKCSSKRLDLIKKCDM
jgi:hypothetical protein